VNEFNAKIDILMDKLRTVADGSTPVVMFNEINRVLLDIIASVGFGMNVDSVNEPQNELNANVYDSLKGFYRYTFDPFLEVKFRKIKLFIFHNFIFTICLQIFFISKQYKPTEWRFLYNYKRTLRRLRNLGRRHILKQLLAIQEGQYLSENILGTVLKNFSNYLNNFSKIFFIINTNDSIIQDTKEVDLEDMVDNFLTFFVAGQETTANTLAFSLLELGKNPKVFQK
jgi:cholesterol 24(S)-hydroxylase